MATLSPDVVLSSIDCARDGAFRLLVFFDESFDLIFDPFFETAPFFGTRFELALSVGGFLSFFFGSTTVGSSMGSIFGGSTIGISTSVSIGISGSIGKSRSGGGGGEPASSVKIEP